MDIFHANIDPISQKNYARLNHNFAPPKTNRMTQAMTMPVIMTIQQKNGTRNASIDVIARFTSKIIKYNSQLLSLFSYKYFFFVESLFASFVLKGVLSFFCLKQIKWSKSSNYQGKGK